MMIHSLNHYSDSSEKMQRCHRYIHALEQERRKVLVFQRELPLCLEIVTQAIEACKRQLSGSTTENNLPGQSESSEQTSAVPVLEEFIPIKKASSASNVVRDECKNPNGISHKDEGNCSKDKNNNNNPNKSDWLRSAQLWNQTSDPPHIQENSFENIHIKEVPRTGAFHQTIQKEQINLNTQPLSASTSSTAENSRSENKINKKKEGKPSQRKTRRCWSPELHKRFLQALKQLGGSDAATPKQIRELMKVDGLTNDEVKSHLQKYRLHTKRPSSSVSNTTTNTPQTAQFVVVGGILFPSEYSLAAKSGESPIPASNGILTSLPQNVKELSESPKTRGCSHSDSPVTSSPKHRRIRTRIHEQVQPTQLWDMPI